MVYWFEGISIRRWGSKIFTKQRCAPNSMIVAARWYTVFRYETILNALNS